MSLSRDSKLREQLGVPRLVLNGIDVERKVARVDAVDEVAESATAPVRAGAEAGTLLHVAALGFHSGLLVDLLHLATVKLEGLSRLATKDEHISVVQLDARHRLRAHELNIVDFKLCPLLAGNWSSEVTTVLVAFELHSCTSVELVDE